MLGVAASWPIYQTAWLFVPAAAGLLLGAGVAAAARRRSIITSVMLLFVVFVLTLVPVAVPSALAGGPESWLAGLFDGLAATVLGFKQVLTLTLPVGTYLTVMVPAYLVFVLTAFLTTTLALRARRFAPYAAVPLTFGVAFGTVFGSSVVSSPLVVGSIVIVAPREIGLWVATALLSVMWVWLTAGADRRASLRRGRVRHDDHPVSVSGLTQSGTLHAPARTAFVSRFSRWMLGALTVLIALAVAFAITPLVSDQSRQVPRDSVDPLIVLREQPSPLASYRAAKTDAALDSVMFTVTADGQPPSRLRMAVLDHYNGVDFTVGEAEAGRFTRFASASRVSDPVRVKLTVGDGYQGVWVPISQLGSVPVFFGERAKDLADGFFVNREAVAAIAAPIAERSGAEGTGSQSIASSGRTVGLQSGDGFEAMMSATAEPTLTSAPGGNAEAFDVNSMPELAHWLDTQRQPATAAGYLELVQRLRDRGYLSHSISQEEGTQLWLNRLRQQYGTGFESSAGGHSVARIEQLFEQLNTQEALAGEDPPAEALVAGIGDDEQFATAAALIARALGFDSRVVLGVRTQSATSEVPGVPECVRQCTGENLAAWVEVRGADGVWVAVDVTPQVSIRPSLIEEGEQLPEFATTPEERDAKEIEPPIGIGDNSNTTEPVDPLPGPAWVWEVLRVAGLSLLALVLLLVPFAFIPFAKRRREARRRAETDTELSALGAWQTLVENAIDDGVAVPAGVSRSEVAAAIGTAPAAWAAATADRAVFSAAGVSQHDTDFMWAAVEADRAERTLTFSRWQSLRSWFSLRSFGVKVRFWQRGSQTSAVNNEPSTLVKGVQ